MLLLVQFWRHKNTFSFSMQRKATGSGKGTSRERGGGSSTGDLTHHVIGVTNDVAVSSQNLSLRFRQLRRSKTHEPKGDDGHFVAAVRVNRMPVPFTVDVVFVTNTVAVEIENNVVRRWAWANDAHNTASPRDTIVSGSGIVFPPLAQTFPGREKDELTADGDAKHPGDE